MKYFGMLAFLSLFAISSVLADLDTGWHTLDSGGGHSSGGSWEITGTIGQCDAFGTVAGSVELHGGFWPGLLRHRLVGDMNCDGAVNNFDIDPFVFALTDATMYEMMFPGCDILAGDINQDGMVNNFDIDPFVSLLTGG